MKLEKIPETLRSLSQWILWHYETGDGDKPAKIPYSVRGHKASSTNADHWCDFPTMTDHLEGDWQPGFVFLKGGKLCGVDLDCCRNAETGEIAEWAKEIILYAGTYAEVSPSGSGVKLIAFGVNPHESGKRKEFDNLQSMVEGKKAAIEIYDWGRYFAITGERLSGIATEPQDAQFALDWLKAKYWAMKFGAHQQKTWKTTPIIDRARAYLKTIPGAISGQGGDKATFTAACRMVLGFGLSEDEAFTVLSEWNQSCKPLWSDKELWHKVRGANKQNGERCYLRDTLPEHWEDVKHTEYVQESEAPREVPFITLNQAAMNYIAYMKQGGSTLIDFGITAVDYSIGGGIEPGEMVILAARPSHGKSAVALQCVHTWTAAKMPCLLVSEEMSSMMLGKRTLQFASGLPKEHWRTSVNLLESELCDFMADRAECYIAESCGTAEIAVAQIDRAVNELGIKAAIVDYAQLLRSPGKSRYEQVTNTSIALRQCASRNKIVLLVLAQLSRGIESRERFSPQMSDLKDSGQLEQDADVVMFLVWPWKLDQKQPPNDFQFYIAKNRNREINCPAIKCKFTPARQMIEEPKAEDCDNYVEEFTHWSNK